LAKFRCVCGHVISTSNGIPNPNEWHVLANTTLDEMAAPIELMELLTRSRYAYRCPRSDRLWIFWEGLGSRPSLYGPLPIEWSEEP
jgi:hypothetical protein